MFNKSSPPSGGLKIPPKIQSSTIDQAHSYAATRPWHADFQLNLRFKNQFCYLDASKKEEDSFPLGRLRYFGQDNWSLALYTYSNERYEPCIFPSGNWFGTLEEAIDLCELYLI